MARLASQMKGAVTLACSVVSSIAFGFASRRFDQPSGKWGLFACFGLATFFVQLGLVFTKSKEEAELAEFKRIQSAQNERNAVEIEIETKIMNAVSERLEAEIQSGSIDDVERWNAMKRSLYGK